MANGNQLPEGFVLDSDLPAGFVIEEPEAGPQLSTMQRLDQAILSIPGMPLVAEFAAGANRSLADIIDFFGSDTINAALEIAGVDQRVPTARQGLEAVAGPSGRGTFAQGLAGEAAATAGELAPAAAAIGAGLRGVAGRLGPQVAGESTARGVTRQLAATTPGQDIGAAVASGAGQEFGRAVGGETGALVGGLAAPVLGAVTSQGVKSALTNKFGKRIDLINPKTALPEPALQKALDRRGVSYGAFIDEPDLIPYVAPGQTADDVVDAAIKRQIKSGSTGKSLAPFRIQADKVVDDELAKRVIRQGYDPGDIQMIKGANSYTRGKMQDMLKMKRKALEDRSFEFRPGDVAGDDVLKEITYVRGQADKLRSQLNTIAKNELGNQRINTFAIEDEVIKGLDDLNIQIPDIVRANTILLDKFLTSKGAFKFSDISKSKSDQKVIKDVIGLLSEEGPVNALRAHRLKRQLDNMIDYRRHQSLLTPSGERFAKGIRFALNKSIRGVNQRYAQINDELSEALGTLSGITDVMPKKINLFAPSANESIGQEMRKLVTNYNTRIPMRDAIRRLDKTASSMGGQFDGQTFRMINFATALDDRFGEAARGGLGAKQEMAFRRALSKEGIADEALKAAAERVKKARGLTDEGALNDMQKLLIRGK